MKPKRTTALTLVLIGSVSLTACSETPTVERKTYRNLEDCRLEWGGADKCEMAANTSTAWYGPRYTYMNGQPYYYRGSSDVLIAAPQNAGIRRFGASRAIRTQTITRGGFGRISFRGFGG